ncbi:hypothetical protein PtrM4_118850 [Pyrenophora tritici-repentis]|uniref:Uncharacterized protein n=1 Tax=Pyrenophora tritici-repentis TaxID=45151 RepID=A0A834VMR9_9PLEO|nr:hypothetical protein PtrM4_118850 [Pyrenophora tritici-repentis]
MQYPIWFTAGIIFSTTRAQTTNLTIYNNRTEGSCAPSINLCSRTNWQDCYAPITTSSRCVPADRLDKVASIAIDLGLCCRFYTDDKCITPFAGYGGTQAWYPGTSQVEDAFKEQVGSYTCRATKVIEGCPGSAMTNGSASISAAYVTTTHSVV